MKTTVRWRWLSLVLLILLLLNSTPGFATGELAPTSLLAAAPEPFTVELDTAGGTVDLADLGDLVVPSGALAARSRFSRYTVELRLASGLFRYHPIAPAIHVEARRSDNGSPVTQLGQPATLRLKLDRPDIPPSRLQRPAVRALGPSGWELVPSAYDPTSMTLVVNLAQLPATLAVVDDSQPVAAPDWDPKDPAAVQFADGGWGVAYVDGANPPNLLYRRTLGSQDPAYWVDAATVDSNSDSPALAKLGSTTALFYRKLAGTYRQVFLRTSTDDGLT